MGIKLSGGAPTSKSIAPSKPKILNSLGPFQIIPCDIENALQVTLAEKENTYTVKFLNNDKLSLKTGRRSPVSPINVSEGTKEKIKVPIPAVSFAWLYPLEGLEEGPGEMKDEEKFAYFGGFVYLDKNGKVVGVNAVDSVAGKDLEFIGPYIFNDAVKTIQLEKDNRIQGVTLPALKEKGITHFCWLTPNEKRTDGTILCTNGAFLYLHSTGTFYFKVKDTSKPVWEWEFKSLWQAFDSLSSQKLEEAYAVGKEQLNLNLDTGQYSFDFINMKQLNLKTGEVKTIRRTFWADTQATSKWECYVKKKWEPYSPEENESLDTAFFSSALCGSESTITLSRLIDSNIIDYEIDFVRLKQKNLHTSFERPIRRAGTSVIQNQRIPWAKRTRVKVEDRNIAPEHRQPCYGTIGITVKGARNIAITSTSSPSVFVTTDFCSFSWSTSLRSFADTASLPTLVGPKPPTETVWNEDCTIDVVRENSSGSILFTIYDIRDNDPTRRIYMGRLSLGLSEIMRMGSGQFWKPLDFESDKKSTNLPPGELELSVFYNPRDAVVPTVRNDSITNDRIGGRPNLQNILSNPNVLKHLSALEQLKLKAMTPKSVFNQSGYLKVPPPTLLVTPPTQPHSDHLAPPTPAPVAQPAPQHPDVPPPKVVVTPALEAAKHEPVPVIAVAPPPQFVAIEKSYDLSPYKDMDIVEGENGIYALGKKLGSGAFGIVKRATNIKNKQTVAIKIIGIDDCNEREIQIMRVVKNLYCVSFIDCLETDESFYIVMEFCSQGDLFDAIEADILDEPRVQKAAYDTLKGLQYLHRSGICHRDIKPENILHYVGVDEKNNLVDNWKVADFGIATFFTEGKMIVGSTGTTQYKAPEMFPPAKYTKAVDLWAVGITIYVCLTGRFVWAGEADDEVLDSIQSYRIDYDNEFSSTAFSIILRLLDLNPETRMTIEEAFSHQWLTRHHKQ